MENKTYYLGGSLEAERAHQRERLAALAAERAAAYTALVNAPGPSLLEILGVEPSTVRKFQVEKRGKRAWVLIRQMAHDPQYRVGSHIPAHGKVVAIEEVR
jgi:hypothetical protein